MFREREINKDIIGNIPFTEIFGLIDQCEKEIKQIQEEHTEKDSDKWGGLVFDKYFETAQKIDNLLKDFFESVPDDPRKVIPWIKVREIKNALYKYDFRELKNLLEGLQEQGLAKNE
jgi:hypothetical protein